jgi:hypothetical protein
MTAFLAVCRLSINPDEAHKKRTEANVSAPKTADRIAEYFVRCGHRRLPQAALAVWFGGRRYFGSTKTRTERDAEAFERAIRERALRGFIPTRKRRPQRLRKYPINQPLIGVYLLLLNDEVVYIGTSLNMPERVATHRQHGRAVR